jgi:subtilisin family serine protease
MMGRNDVRFAMENTSRKMLCFGNYIAKVLVVALGGHGLVASAQSLLSIPPSAQFHPSRILVQPRGDADLNALHITAGARVLRSFPALGELQLVELAPGDTVPAAILRYQQTGLVEFAEPDYKVSAALAPNDPRIADGTQWAMHNTGQSGGVPDADSDVLEAWDVLNSASNVIVAVIDSGIRLTHEDLAANLWTNPQDGSHGIRSIGGVISTNVADDFGHGTHVAGTIGAVGNNGKGVSGVAWRVKIMACKFLDHQGDGFNADAVTCLEFARSNGAAVINMSYAGGVYSDAVSNAIWAARDAGIACVAAAGNQGRNNDVFPRYPANMRIDNLVSVGASTHQDLLWAGSNYGANRVHMFAPGEDIYSTTFGNNASYGYMSGTSMAAPHVSGTLALLRAQLPAAPVQELIARLLSATDRRAAFSGKCTSGGRLNLLKALDQVRLTAVQPCSGCATETPVELQLAGAPGHTYVVQASTNLINWAALSTNTVGLNGLGTFVDALSTNLPDRYYRGIPAL